MAEKAPYRMYQLATKRTPVLSYTEVPDSLHKKEYVLDSIFQKSLGQ